MNEPKSSQKITLGCTRLLVATVQNKQGLKKRRYGVRSVRGKVGALIASVSLAGVLTACGGSEETATALPEPTEPTPVETTAAPTASPSTEPTPTVESEFDSTVNSEFGVSASGNTETDRWGEYETLSVDDDSPLMQYDPDLYPSVLRELYGNPNLEVLHKTAHRFLIEQSLDSIVLNDYDPENWQEEIAFLVPHLTEGALDRINPEIIPSIIDVDYDERYVEGTLTTPRYDGGVRTMLQKIELTSVEDSGNGAVDMTWNMEYMRKESFDASRSAEITHNTERKLRFQMENGEWKVRGAWVTGTYQSELLD